MNRLIFISIIFNIILGLAYLFFSQRDNTPSNFKEWQNWQKVIQTDIIKNKAHEHDAIIRILDKKPKLKSQITGFFIHTNQVESEVYSFFKLFMDKSKITNTLFKKYIKYHNFQLDSLLEKHNNYIKIVQKEAKLTNQEVEDKNNNFKKLIHKNYIYWDSIPKMSAFEKRNFVLLKSTNLLNINREGQIDFLGLLGGRLYLERLFPIITMNNNYINKDEELKIMIQVGHIYQKSLSNGIKLSINNKERNLTPYNDNYIDTVAYEKGWMDIELQLDSENTFTKEKNSAADTFKIWVK